MKTNIRIFLLCSVPEDQKPIQEYLSFQENFLFDWITLAKKNYQQKLLWITFINFCNIIFLRFLFSPLKIFNQTFEQILENPFAFFPQMLRQNFFDWVFQNCFWGTLLTTFLIAFIFTRCNEIQKHFFEPRLTYEEASWYDGQIWEKPFLLLKNDRLLSTQKLQPILKRLRGTFFFLLTLNLCFFLLFF
jgi:hypothetical protein